jgi:hypothetical protein
MPQADPLTGGCNCGAVRYEVTEPLVGASYFHCRRCQRRSGAAASPNAHPQAGAFRIVKGEAKLRHWTPTDGGEKWFCGNCGPSIFGRNHRHDDPIGIAWARSTPIPGSDPPPGRSSPMPRPGSQSPRTACPGTPGPDTPGPEKAAARAQRRFLLSRTRANAITRQSTLTRAPEWKAGAGCNLVGTEVLLIEAFDA